MGTRRYSRSFPMVTLPLLGAALLGLPAPMGAQGTDWEIRRAEAMEAEARSLADQRDRWDHAAWLYREAATLRPRGDVEAVGDLQMAGRLAYYAGDLKQAEENLAAAGRRAMEGGDVLTAGDLWIDAAWVAEKRGGQAHARDLVREARLVLASDVLSEEVRNTVLGRIDARTGRVAVAASFARSPAPF